MVAINGRELLRRAVGLLRNHYNRCITKIFRGGATTLGRSSSFVHTNLKKPFPKVAPVPPKRTWTRAGPHGQTPKDRKQGRVKRRKYNELAKDNSTVFMPGAYHNGPKSKTVEPRSERDDESNGYESRTAYKGKTGRATRERRERRANNGANEREAFVKRQLESLMFEKLKREAQFEVKGVSARVKRQAAERRAKMREQETEAAKVWKMEELERREEKERADRWKEQRLAQLEREKRVAESELAREKAERKQSNLQRVFKEQQKRHKEEYWKQLRESEAKVAAEREANLLHENAVLEDNLRLTDSAFRRACNERDHMVQEIEEERARRLRVEESLYRWKELMKEYFPGGQQHPDQRQELQPQPEPQPEPPSLEVQFELYEKKWEVLRSGVDIDGTEVHLISFSQIPWPVINTTPTDPSQILPEYIQEFLMHPLRDKPDTGGKRKTTRLKARDELMRWHSDKFTQVVLSKVRGEDKPAASEAAETIARVLTCLLS